MKELIENMVPAKDVYVSNTVVMLFTFSKKYINSCKSTVQASAFTFPPSTASANYLKSDYEGDISNCSLNPAGIICKSSREKKKKSGVKFISFAPL